MKCVSYTRTLPWKNHQSELTIAEQNQRIAAYLAEHKELDLLKKYSDRKNDEKARTAFDQMTDDGVERKFDCIIVASMYYCGPDFPAARQAIKETLYATGIDLIVLDEGLDTRTASRKEVEDYFEAKRCEMHAEIMFAWRRKQGAGFRLTNSVPFGYLRRNGESNMIKDEEVAPYLSEAFSRYASGQKMRDIAKWLNEQGVEPPMRHKKRILGKPYDAESDQWTTDMLRCLFRNPTYTGAAANGSRQIIAENCHEPYITKEQFHAFPCNMREGENKISIRKSYKKPNPLAKHIVCICGRALCWHKDKKTGEELFYCRYCRAHKENGKNLKVPAATIYKKVMDALELEHLEKEKLAAAIQQGAGRKAIEVVRAEKSVQMKSVLAELNMEQFRRVPLYESYIADEITEEQYRAELLDYEEAHRKLNEQLTTIMEDTLVWERALSLRNPWIQQMAQYKTPEELDRNFVKKYMLNDENVPVPSVYNKENKAYGKETTYTIAPVILWDSSRVWKILTAYVYTGAMVLGKTKTLISGKSIVRTVPKGQQFITEGTHEAIVSREEFEKAQLVIKSNSHKVLMGRVDFPLKGKVRCGNCRRVMAHNFKQVVPTFWCREGLELVGQTQCTSEIFQVSDIESAVFQALKKELSLLDSLYGDIQKEEQDLKEAHKKANRRKTLMEQELKNLKGEKMRMYEEYAAGTLPLDTYKQKKQECDRRISEVEEKIELEKGVESTRSAVPGTVRAAAEQAENFLHGTRLTAGMVSAFIENVFVHDGGRIVVRFKYEQSIQDTVKALQTG